jgi:hypothetical protein
VTRAGVERRRLGRTDIVASVRPWKAPWVVTISNAPPRWSWPHLRASLMAPSLASAPVLHRKTESSPFVPAARLASRAIASLW